jgi:hypothetical protein
MMGTAVFMVVMLAAVAAGFGIYDFVCKCSAIYKELDK